MTAMSKNINKPSAFYNGFVISVKKNIQQVLGEKESGDQITTTMSDRTHEVWFLY